MRKLPITVRPPFAPSGIAAFDHSKDNAADTGRKDDAHRRRSHAPQRQRPGMIAAQDGQRPPVGVSQSWTIV
jgi:hypothetical protein